MLYRVQIPKLQSRLRLVVQLQERLLEAVCDPQVSATVIDFRWLARVFHDVELVWVKRFAHTKDKVAGSNRTVLDNVRTIAGFSDPRKHALLADFRSDLSFAHAYNAHLPPHPFRGLSSLQGEPRENIKAVRGLLECFYDPIIYKVHGYRLTDSGGQVQAFCKDDYLGDRSQPSAWPGSYVEANPKLDVCPYCDGRDEVPELDHFLKKASFPGLSCHPLNLIPICGACNSGANKGQKIVFTRAAADPVERWLHPYLRPVSPSFSVIVSRQGGRLSVALRGHDTISQHRLDTLDRLVNLKVRWNKELQRTFDWVLRQVDAYKREIGYAPSEQELLAELGKWHRSACADIGMEAHALLKHALLTEAIAENPDVFIEIWKYSQEDPTP